MSILNDIVRTKWDEIEQLKLKSTIHEWIDRAHEGVEIRDFAAVLEGSPPIRLIAEVKRASPSQGLIRKDFDAREIAIAYQAAGAHCLSVLTDECYFQGSLSELAAVKQSVTLPVLRKDFILDPIQVWQARAFGADAVLLIAECLGDEQLSMLYETILEARMTPLVELYDEQNIERVQRLNPRLVGVNNRNLNTFEVDLRHSIRIRSEFRDDQIFVAESGIKTHDDVRLLERSGVDAMLVGQSLCEKPDISHATRMLLYGTNQ